MSSQSLIARLSKAGSNNRAVKLLSSGPVMWIVALLAPYFVIVETFLPDIAASVTDMQLRILSIPWLYEQNRLWDYISGSGWYSTESSRFYSLPEMLLENNLQFVISIAMALLITTLLVEIAAQGFLPKLVGVASAVAMFSLLFWYKFTLETPYNFGWTTVYDDSTLFIPLPLITIFQLLHLHYSKRDWLKTKRVTQQMDNIEISSGHDNVGENVKIAVKVENQGELTITNVVVNLDVSDGFEFARNTTPSMSLGVIPGGAFQSAIFWLKPLRCLDDEYGGSVVFRDATNTSRVISIPAKRIVNICPMLTTTENADEIFSRVKFGSLTRNCASFGFTGPAKGIFSLAESRLVGLKPFDRLEQQIDDDTYIAYSCYIGKTKYGDKDFAAEIQVSGTAGGGVLTLTIYSDDERIMGGFVVDIMQNVREHARILEEKACPIATCPKCGGNLDLSKINESRLYKCPFCGVMGRVAPWV